MALVDTHATVYQDSLEFTVNSVSTIHCLPLGGADSRVVSHSTVVQEVPGSNPGDAEKCWAVMELFVNIYLYEFVLSLLCVFVVTVCID